MGRNKYFGWVCLGFFLVVVDQFSKWFFPTVSLNNGVSFGIKIGSSSFSQLTILVIVFGSLVAWVFQLFSSLRNWSRWGVILVLAGAFSNILDRVFVGGVRDWLIFPFFSFTNNIADIWITLGVVCILVETLNQKKL